MEDELQEGIELETINSGEVVIDNDVDIEATQENNQETAVDDDKTASLQRGLNKERALRKAAEKRSKELEAKFQERLEALEKANKETEKSTLETLIESGVDESIAKSIATAIDKKQVDTKKFEKEIADLKFDNSLKALSKEEEYADIEDYADEIKDLVDKGLTIEQSYHAVAYDKPKTQNTKSEMQRKLEVKMQNNNSRREILQNANNNSGVANNSKAIKISSSEKAIAAAAGLTPEEYVALRDTESIKDYEEYKSRKKK